MSTHEGQPSSVSRPSAELSSCCKKHLDTLPSLSALRKESERDKSSNYLLLHSLGREKTDVPKYSLIKILEAKSFHSRMSEKGETLQSMEAEKGIPPNRKANCGQSLKAREVTTEQLVSIARSPGRAHTRELGTRPGLLPLAFSGHLVLWFNSLWGAGRTRGQHHHVLKGYYGNNVMVRNQLEFGLYAL